MRKFDQLSADEQSRAEGCALDELLQAVIQGSIRFNDKLNRSGLQARINAAIGAAESNQTPWFAHEFIMETCSDDLRSMAQADAEDALYPDPTERIICI